MVDDVVASPMTVRFEVLGSLRAIRADGSDVDLGRHQQRAVMALLVANAGSVVSLDRIIEGLWGDDESDSDKLNTVRVYISGLRSALEPDRPPRTEGSFIRTQAPGYLLDIDRTDVDAARFEQMVADARRRVGADPEQAIASFLAAEGLWRGDPYAEFADLPFAAGEVARLHELRVAAIEDRISAQLDLGHDAELIPELEQLVAEHRHRERLAGQLMLALYRSHRQPDALRVYQSYRARLADELGLDPSPALAELESQIVVGDPLLLARAEPVAHRVRSYELAERLGEGSFSIVYRGRQPSVDRDVAVKVIRAELANDPDFVRRFEAEAHVVARLEHPHIVPLYDFWREPGAAFLVMRWLRGGTLHSKLVEMPISIEECVTMVEQVGDALSLAHRHGVVHRDVKPANVFLDGDGRFYLGDFGIAVDSHLGPDPVASLSLGSPAYASPEQLSRRDVGPATDVYGLAVSVYEALSGQLPFEGATTQAELTRLQLNEAFPPLSERVPGLPGAVDQVIALATTKDPAQRISDVQVFVDMFREAVLGTAAPTTAAPAAFGKGTLIAGEAECPYVGLAAFEAADADRFHGRDRLVAQVVDRLSTSRMVTVVGPSGSGKSSLVKAGCVPALRRGAAAGSQGWFYVTMTPGRDPYEELEAALLRVAVNPPASLREQLVADERGIARAVQRVVPEASGQVLLVLDQFEELFTLTEDEQLRRRFLRALVAAATDDRSGLRVIATCRADYFDRPLNHPELAQLMRDGAIPITPLAPDELERAIVDPAMRVGVEFEPGLVSAIVADVNDQPGALPMLQFALTRLWGTRVSGLITMAAYGQLGGVSGALAAEAEALFGRLEEQEQVAAREVFRRLVTPGEGRGDTRRRVTIAELEQLDGATKVVETYGAARLLSFDRNRDSREPTVEVAHEALLREWPRLLDWINEDRDALRVHRHLAASAAAWEAASRDAGELYRSGRLDAAVELEGQMMLTGDEQAFLNASRDARQSEAETERRRVRRLRLLLSATAVVAVIALVATVVAFGQQRRANDEADRATAEAIRAADETARAEAALFDSQITTIVSTSARLTSENPVVSLLLAVDAYTRAPSNETLGGLLGALQGQVATSERIEAPPIERAFCGAGGDSTDGLVTSTRDGISIWAQGDSVIGQNQATGEITTITSRSDPCAWPIRTYSDGPIINFGLDAITLDPRAAGEAIHLIDVVEPVSLTTSGGPDAVVGVVVNAAVGDVVHLFDGDGESIAIVDGEFPAQDVFLSRSGDAGLIIEATDNVLEPGRVQFVDPRTGTTGWTQVIDAAPQRASFSPSASRVAVTDGGGSATVLDTSTGEIVEVVRSEQGLIWTTQFVGDDRLAVIDGTSVEIHAIGGTDVRVLGSVPDATWELQVLDDGRIAVVVEDGDVLLFDTTGGGIAEVVKEFDEGRRVSISESGFAGIADLATGSATVVDMASGAETAVNFSVPRGGFPIAVQPLDPGRHVVVSIDGELAEYVEGELARSIALFDAPGHSIILGSGHSGTGGLHYLRPDGSGVAYLVDFDGMEVIGEPIETDACHCRDAYPTPDGEGLVIQRDGTLTIHRWDGTEATIELAGGGSDGGVYAADPPTNRLLRGDIDGAVELLDFTTMTASLVTNFGVAIQHVDFVSDGRAVVLLGDGSFWLVDLERGERIGLLATLGGGRTVIGDLFAIDDGRTVWVATTTEIAAFEIDEAAWLTRACELAGRELTDEEWAQFMPAQFERRSTCSR